MKYVVTIKATVELEGVRNVEATYVVQLKTLKAVENLRSEVSTGSTYQNLEYKVKPIE